ncbi:MAG: hypothetical protein ACREX3_14095 [Gammaproteobacteria bacterium]
MVALAAFFHYRLVLKRAEIDVRSKIAKIKRTYGVNVHHQYDPTIFWKAGFPPLSTKGTDIGISHAHDLLEITEEFLSQYPAELVRKHLSDIVLVKHLEFYGKAFGGTYSRSAIFIGTNGGFFRYLRGSVLGTMHAEFSSILFSNYTFPRDVWEAANQPYWRYEGSGFEMLGRRDVHDRNSKLWEDGFLEKYAQTSLENDFNTFVEWLFTRTERLGVLAATYERINRKCNLAIEFLQSVHSRIRIPKPCTGSLILGDHGPTS